jgi:hypothetical protein
MKRTVMSGKASRKSFLLRVTFSTSIVTGGIVAGMEGDAFGQVPFESNHEVASAQHTDVLEYSQMQNVAPYLPTVQDDPLWADYKTQSARHASHTHHAHGMVASDSSCGCSTCACGTTQKAAQKPLKKVFGKFAHGLEIVIFGTGGGKKGCDDGCDTGCDSAPINDGACDAMGSNHHSGVHHQSPEHHAPHHNAPQPPMLMQSLPSTGTQMPELMPRTAPTPKALPGPIQMSPKPQRVDRK